VPESKRHLLLRTLLFRILAHAYGHRACIGSEQFVYWDADDPSRCVAPDAFVRLGTPDEEFDSWKTWERGTPELCVEIASRSDRPDTDWEDELARYRQLGVLELVRFDPPTGALRVWDRRGDELVERVIQGASSPCTVVGATWVVVPHDGKAALRLADPAGTELVPTPEEAAARRIAELESLLRERNPSSATADPPSAIEAE